ncbi:MAG: hypothetical protein P8Z30_08960 [Acidobacteriota bacterium]
MKPVTKFFLLLLAISFAAPLALTGVETSVWQVSDFKEFLKGRLTGISISMDGQLGLAPQAKAVFSPEEALALSLATDRRHDLYIGTGHQGKVFRVTPDGKSSLFFKAQEPDVFAVAIGPDGDLYVGSSPEGKVYRVTPQGKSSVFYDPDTKYIWALRFDPQGRLYVATGDHGQIFRVDRNGKGKIFFDSNQTHIMCMVFDHQGNLLAGSVPNGLIYRINPEGKGFVIYQANLPEIHDLIVGPEGHIYAAALGAPSRKGVPMMITPQTPTITLPPHVVTVTAGTREGSTEAKKSPVQKPKEPEKPKPPAQKKQQAAASFIRPGTGLRGLAGLMVPQSRGEIIRISPDSTAETLWNSNTESAYGLAMLGKKLLFSTDSNGQIFELDPSHYGENLTLLTETHESVATRLLLEGNSLYVATSNVAKLFRMGTAAEGEGTYESRVYDTKFISRWGVISWRDNVPAGSSIEFYTRSGNFKRPDQTWSDWAGPYEDPNGTPIKSPSARYIQWKAVFRGTESARPILDEVSVFYLNQNVPPAIQSFSVSNSGEKTSPSSASAETTTPGVSVNVTATPQITYLDPPQTAHTETKSPVTLSWKASDPNGDTLEYSVYAKSTDEKNWHLLKDKIKSTHYTIHSSSLADGQYVALLVASDALSNPPATARKDRMVSTPFWIDNTPPTVSVERNVVKGKSAVVHFRVEDTTSPLHSAESSVDSGSWQAIESDEGIIDTRNETFTVKADNLAPGEHIVTLRASDMAGNVGVGTAVVEIPGR